MIPSRVLLFVIGVLYHGQPKIASGLSKKSWRIQESNPENGGPDPGNFQKRIDVTRWYQRTYVAAGAAARPKSFHINNLYQSLS